MKLGRAAATSATVALAIVACNPFAKELEPHPRNVEAATGEPSDGCEGATVVAVEALVSGMHGGIVGGAGQPAAVAVDGKPKAQLACTQLGCSFECCDNSCGASTDCAFAVEAPDGSKLCLAHSTFECGGTDCSAYCVPFSTDPRHRYRFVGTPRSVTPGRGSPTLDVTKWCLLD